MGTLDNTNHWWALSRETSAFVKQIRNTFEERPKIKSVSPEFAEWVERQYGYDFIMKPFLEVAERMLFEIEGYHEMELRIDGGEDWHDVALTSGYSGDEAAGRDGFVRFLRDQYDTLTETLLEFTRQVQWFFQTYHSYEQEHEPERFTPEDMIGETGEHHIQEDGSVICPE